MKLDVEIEAAPMAARNGQTRRTILPLRLRGGEGRGEVVSLSTFNPQLSTRLVQFTKFCLVGGSGVLVDMGILYLLADPSRLGWNITLSKICAAEIAMINNFIWNELWTFRSNTPSLSAIGGEGRGEVAVSPLLGERDRVRADQPSPIENRKSKIAGRFLLFNAICGIGIGIAVLLLHLFHTWLGWNLYVSNLLAIILVTSWNFAMNARFNWQRKQTIQNC